MKCINRRNPNLPSKESVQRIKTEAAAMALDENYQGKSELKHAHDEKLFCGNAITTALKRSVNASRLKTYNLEIQLLEENILIMEGKLDSAAGDTGNKAHTVEENQQSIAHRKKLHAAVQSSHRKVAVRRAEIKKLPLQSEINKHSTTRWSRL